METPSGSITGILLIGALVAAGVWYSRDSAVHEVTHAGASHPEESPAGFPSASGRRVDWSADGRSLLILSRNGADVHVQMTLHYLARPHEPTTVNLPGDVVSGASLAIDDHVLAATHEGRLWWIDSATGEPAILADLAEESAFTATAVAPGGRLVAAGTLTGAIYVCEPTALPAIRLPTARASSITDLCFSDDGQFLLSASGDGAVGLWNVKTLALVREFAGHQRSAMSAAFLRDNRQVISVGLDDTTRIWNTETGSEEWRGEFGLGGVRTLAVTADGRTAVWGGFDQRFVVWDVERHQKTYEIRTAMPMVAHVRFSPDATRLAVAGAERFVRIYEVRTGTQILEIPLDSPVR